MLNQTKTARKGRFSNFLANRNPQNFNFLRENKGSVSSHTLETGAVKIIFKSRVTRRTAFAYGRNFSFAYKNLIRNFNLKYN